MGRTTATAPPAVFREQETNLLLRKVSRSIRSTTALHCIAIANIIGFTGKWTQGAAGTTPSSCLLLIGHEQVACYLPQPNGIVADKRYAVLSAVELEST